MIEVEDLPELRAPVIIAAFEGWNDAAEAASNVVDHLARVWHARPVAAIDPEEYYDFQVNRPRVGWVDGERRISWPTTRVLVSQDSGLDRDVLLIQGIEPSTRWRSFVVELLELAREVDASLLVCLGALLGEVAHSRDFPVAVLSDDPDMARRFTVDESNYEGPTGIVGVLADAARQASLPVISCWASVPHYAAGNPSPKGTLALLTRIETLLGASLPHGQLAEQSRQWERDVDQLAAADQEVADYVRSLEQAQDAAEHPGASGDAIAKEFERYLRKRGSEGS
ncbi:MAG TPA: PAC2 family protein [Dermatophilaceae bacterium]|nr:PAC2 family protein [Dermatophilaceae bacterium]